MRKYGILVFGSIMIDLNSNICRFKILLEFFCNCMGHTIVNWLKLITYFLVSDDRWKPYKCIVCSKAFRLKDNINLHMAKHKLPKVYHSPKMTKKVHPLPSNGLVTNASEFVNRMRKRKDLAKLKIGNQIMSVHGKARSCK